MSSTSKIRVVVVFVVIIVVVVIVVVVRGTNEDERRSLASDRFIDRLTSRPRLDRINESPFSDSSTSLDTRGC